MEPVKSFLAASGTITRCESLLNVIQSQGKLVDSLPGYSRRMMEIFLDYLATECGIGLPSVCGERPFEEGAVWFVTCLNRHESVVVRSQIEKRRLLAEKAPTWLFGAYGFYVEDSADAARRGSEFLRRQAGHFQSDEERLLIVVEEVAADLMQ